MRLIFEWVKVATDKVHTKVKLQIENYLGSERFGPKKTSDYTTFVLFHTFLSRLDSRYIFFAHFDDACKLLKLFPLPPLWMCSLIDIMEYDEQSLKQ